MWLKFTSSIGAIVFQVFLGIHRAGLFFFAGLDFSQRNLVVLGALRRMKLHLGLPTSTAWFLLVLASSFSVTATPLDLTAGGVVGGSAADG